MRVLVVTNLYPPGFQGGYELGCSHVVAALRERGHEVRVLTSTGDGEDGAVWRVLDMAPVFDRAVMGAATAEERRELELRARVEQPANAARLDEQLDDFAPDVVYLWNVVGIGGFALLRRVRERGVPWVWHLMDAGPSQICTVGGELVPELAAELARGPRGRYLACSTHVVGEIRAGGVELCGPVELVPNWVAGPLPPPRTEFFSSGRLRVVCAVGVLVEHKGIDVLIEAAALLATRYDGRFEIDVYGREDDRRFRDRAEARGVAGVVRLRGLLDQRELLRRYGAYDVFAFPTAWREPFAFAPLEAAAAGCVPLISGDAGNAEWMVDGVHCLKARRDPEAFAERLAGVLEGDTALAPIGRRAQAVVRDRFHLPKLVGRIEAALEMAAGARMA